MQSSIVIMKYHKIWNPNLIFFYNSPVLYQWQLDLKFVSAEENFSFLHYSSLSPSYVASSPQPLKNCLMYNLLWGQSRKDVNRSMPSLTPAPFTFLWLLSSSALQQSLKLILSLPLDHLKHSTLWSTAYSVVHCTEMNHRKATDILQ